MRLLTEIKVQAKIANLAMVVQSVSACAKETGVSAEKLMHIELATEEAVANICNYAYPQGAGDIEVRCQADENFFTIEIVDSGIPFDPTAMPDPDISKDIAKRPIGGLGVFFIKKMTDDVKYRREDGRNILILIIRRDSTAPHLRSGEAAR